MIDKTQFKTTVTLYAPKLFQDMGRDDKVRACYLHCCLRYVQREKTTNTTVRERFKIEKRNAPIASKIISQTIEEGLIRIENPNNNSAKFMSYIPYWVAKH